MSHNGPYKVVAAAQTKRTIGSVDTLVNTNSHVRTRTNMKTNERPNNPTKRVRTLIKGLNADDALLIKTL